MKEPFLNSPKLGVVAGCREKIRRFVTSVKWSLVVFSAALADVMMFVSEISRPGQVGNQKDFESWVDDFFHRDEVWTCIILVIYIADVIMKVIVFTWPVYVRKVGNLIDLLVTFTSLVLFLLESIAAGDSVIGFGPQAVAAMRAPRMVKILVRIVQITHCLRGFQWCSRAMCGCVSGVRHMVGGGKTRFVDLEHDFDLDLAYIKTAGKDRLIAMSVPVHGFFGGLYRNPIAEVVRFFETRHRNNYKIINCCPEMPYPHEEFLSGTVHKFYIQDHTPPTISQVVKFLNIASAWMRGDPAHVLAVHCRGGKGRTGSLCGAWMIYNDKLDGPAACRRFAEARTADFEQGNCNLQTVDTPSQVRYLDHVAAMLKMQNFPARVAEPEKIVLRPQRFSMERWFLKPVGDNLVVAVHEVREDSYAVKYWSHTFRPDNEGSAFVELSDSGIELQGDIRISVFACNPLGKARARSPNRSAFLGDVCADGQVPPGKRMIAGEEPGCLFYFMFHTTFVPSGELRVPRDQMDKAGKGKDKKRYYAEGVAKLVCEMRS